MKNLIKVFLVVIIIFFLIEYNVINVLEIIKVFENYNSFLFIFLLMLVTIFIGAFKWWILLRSEKYCISYYNAYLIYSTGIFFNIFMPGGAGGDITKSLYLFSYVKKSQRTLAVFTVIIDRIIGSHALLFVIFVISFFLSDQIFHIPEIKILLYYTTSLMIFSIPAILVIIRYSEKISHYLKGKNYAEGKILETIFKILNALIVYRNRKFIILKCWLISAFNHILLLSCFYLTAISIDINILTFFEATFIGGLSLMANIIPLTPGGIGIGEGFFDFLSNYFHYSNTVAFGSIFFITIRVLFSFVSLVGSISFITLKKPKQLYAISQKKKNLDD
tara:strand:+ start:1724 stop:2722 length:999 start_codon:yes stop_codon:yes gene_type:complete